MVAQDLSRSTTSLAIDSHTIEGGLSRSESAPGIPLRHPAATSPGFGKSPGAQSKSWSSPPGSPATIASRQPTAEAHHRRRESTESGLSRAEEFHIKNKVRAELKETQEGLVRDFVPSLSAIDAIANRPAYARMPARMMRPPASADASVWPPYPTAAGMSDLILASPQTSATGFHSVAPRMTRLETYGRYDPRALLCDGRYGGFHTDYQFDASNWEPSFHTGVLQGGPLGGSRISPGAMAPPGSASKDDFGTVELDAARAPARRRGAKAVQHSSPVPKPGLVHAMASSGWRCSTAFQSRQPRLMGGQPNYLVHDLRQRMAEDAYTGSHVHMYQPPTNADVGLPKPKQVSPAEQAQERLNRPQTNVYYHVDDDYRNAGQTNSTSNDDRFRYGVVVKYPAHKSSSFASTMPVVASEHPKPLEPFARGRPGSELNAQVLSSYPTRQKR